jgi:hypothetical protein
MNAAQAPPEEDERQRLERLEKEFSDWVKTNNLFFEKKFFPAAEKFETLQRLVNASLEK